MNLKLSTTVLCFSFILIANPVFSQNSLDDASLEERYGVLWKFATPQQREMIRKSAPNQNPNATDVKNNKIYSMCRNETEHRKLYEFGKKLAEGWSYWISNKKYAEKKNPVKTQSSFITRSFIGYTDKYGITKDNEFAPNYHCYMGYIAGTTGNSWSSVHKGLSDYLKDSQKTKFLNLPES
jgi:hypothetical protein